MPQLDCNIFISQWTSQHMDWKLYVNKIAFCALLVANLIFNAFFQLLFKKFWFSCAIKSQLDSNLVKFFEQKTQPFLFYLNINNDEFRFLVKRYLSIYSNWNVFSYWMLTKF